jgi:hypothetical protein
MMERHRDVVTRVCQSDGTREAILEHFGLRASLRTGQVFDELQRWGASQADVVLMLVRGGRSEDASILVGRVVPRVCPPCLAGRGEVRRLEEEDEMLGRVIVWIEPECPRSAATARQRWSALRVGRTVGSALQRGFTRRDLRLATRRGWIRLERRAA